MKVKFVWAQLPNTPKIFWPVKMIDKSLVYCKSDDAWLSLKKDYKIHPFTKDVETWKAAGLRLLKRKPLTLKAFLRDVEWALNECEDDVENQHDNEETAKESTGQVMPLNAIDQETSRNDKDEQILLNNTDQELLNNTDQDMPITDTDMEIPGNDTDQEIPVNDKNQIMPVNDTERDIPVNDTEQDIPVNDTDQDIPVNDTNQDIPVNDTEQDIPVNDTEQDIPVNDTNQDIPVNDTNQDIPVNDTEQDMLVNDTDQDIPVNDTEQDMPVNDTEQDIPVNDTEQDIPVNDTNQDLPVNDTNQDMPVNDTDQDIPVNDTEQDIPVNDTDQDIWLNGTGQKIPKINFDQEIQKDKYMEPDCDHGEEKDTDEEIDKDMEMDCSSNKENDTNYEIDEGMEMDCDSDIDPDYIPEQDQEEQESDEDMENNVYSDVNMVSDSAEESDVSDIYPALNSQKNSIHFKDNCAEQSTEDYEDDSDDLDENTVARDNKNKDIYVRLVMKNEYTKTGKLKKSKRVYNSSHPCPLCCKHVTNFSHHILSKKHKNEDVVKKIGKDKEERKRKIQLLRLKGAHIHNVKVLQRKKGEIFLLRRSAAVDEEGLENVEKENIPTFCIDNYGPCPECFGWVLLKSMKRHQKTCCGNDKTKTVGVSISNLLVQSDVLAGKLKEGASKELVQETFTIMQQDEVSAIAKSDPLIVTLGNNWMLRNAGNKIMRRYYTSSVMRLAAKFKMELQKTDTEHKKKDLNEFLQPKFFDLIVSAALKCCSQDDEEDLRNPSNAIKLGYDLKRMASAKLATALKEENESQKKEAEGLIKLMDMEWGVRVNKLARITLTERYYNTEKQLPIPEDIQALATYLQKELSSLDLTDDTYENFRKVVILTLARITLYNRRRCHEVQAMRLTAYRARKTGVDEISKELAGELTSFETLLLERQEVVVIRGKTGKGVPVILPLDVALPLAYLVKVEVRSKCTREDNPYVFANSHVGVFRAYDAIKSVTTKAGLQMPHLIRTSNMRKYFATMLQVFNTTENERQWVIDHLGHTMNVHRVHYRQTSDIIERVDVTKLLLIQDMGLVGQFKGKRLRDIQLNDVLGGSSETDKLANPCSASVSCTSEETCEIDEDYLPQFEEEEEKEEVIDCEQKKGKTKKLKRQRWSKEEEDELKCLFQRNFKENFCPGQKEILRAVKTSQERGGSVQLRPQDNIKKKVSAMLIKQHGRKGKQIK